MARQEHRGLAGGVAAADDDDFLFGAKPRLDRRSPIPDAAAFEISEVFDLGAAIARAARHHDRPRAQHVAVVELQAERAVVTRAIERLHRDRNHDVGAEFLRLVKGPGSQRQPGNSGRKAEVIFNTRAGAGLSAERPRIAHRDGKSLGRSIDRGRQPCGTAADHGDIVDLVLGERANHAHRAGEFGFAWVAEHRAVGDHHQRPIRRRRRITRDQFGRIVVGGRIEQMMREAVAGEKALQANDAA